MHWLLTSTIPNCAEKKIPETQTRKRPPPTFVPIHPNVQEIIHFHSIEMALRVANPAMTAIERERKKEVGKVPPHATCEL